jgi:hypothetical protein
MISRDLANGREDVGGTTSSEGAFSLVEDYLVRHYW